MGTHHARSVLAALAVGAALTATGCTADSGSSSAAPVSAEHKASRTASPSPDAPETSPSVAPQATTAQGADGTDAAGSGKQNPGKRGSGKAGTPWCATDAVSTSLRPGQPAAGNRYATLVLRNTSGAACRTQGYPGLQLTGKSGREIPTDVVRDHSRAPQLVTLAPGDRASARLHWTVVPSEGDPANGKCPDPAGLRVIPPDQRAADSAGWNLGTVCGAGKVQLLPLRAGGGPAD